MHTWRLLTVWKEKMNFSFSTRVAVTAMKSIFSAVCTIDCSQTENAKMSKNRHEYSLFSNKTHPIKDWYTTIIIDVFCFVFLAHAWVWLVFMVSRLSSFLSVLYATHEFEMFWLTATLSSHYTIFFSKRTVKISVYASKSLKEWLRLCKWIFQ